jgi:ubiquinone biosynthesis protein
MLLDFTAMVRARRLTLPAEVALLIRVFVTLEAMGRSLDPDFEIARQIAPFLRRLTLSRYGPSRLLREGGRALVDLTGLLSTLPRQLRRLMRSARGGKVRFHVEVEGLEAFSQAIDRSTTRLTVGIVLAALIIGSSIALTARGGPTVLGLPLFGLLGFAGATLSSLWLLVSIWRSGGGSPHRS